MQTAQVEINKFVGGLVTDASPLTFPENTSSTDINMELNTDGSRNRALGIGYEVGGTEISTGVTSASALEVGINSFRWENVGGNPLQTILCIQVGNQVKFYDASGTTLSGGILGTKDFTYADLSQRFSFAAVDGALVITTGQSYITVATYDGVNFAFTTSSIKVRDFFGVEDVDGGTDLTVGSGLDVRPVNVSQSHLYNLRNQSYAVPRIDGNNEFLKDPVLAFRDRYIALFVSQKFPSNSDTVSGFLYADSTDTDDRNSKRYFPTDSIKNPLGSTRAPQGYFIIDLLNRGTSRLSEVANTIANYSTTYMLPSITLPSDSTPGGPTVVGEFSGRVFFGGFSGDVVDGDSKSPHLSSYIAFSQLVTDPSLITQCYQAGDPTSETSPDIVDTDGGYIRLNNAYDIKAFINLGKSLFVCATNGIWRIFGGNDSGFSATNYVIEKITDKGVRGVNSVVEVENTLLYWADDGIYWLKQNQFGDWISENQCQNRIQTLYNNIGVEDKRSVCGSYDSFQRKVRWLYGNRLYDINQQKELVLNIDLSAFYERHISQVAGAAPPILVNSFNTNTFKLQSTANNITVGGVNVVVGLDEVVLTTSIRVSGDDLFEVGYIAVTQVSPSVNYRFCAYNDSTWTDWKAYDGVGVDAPALLVTGASSGGETMRYKQVPYLHVFLRRTEDGFELNGGGDFVPTNQSSCLIRSRWDWADSANSNKWGTQFQAYRYKRLYLPVDVNDPYDSGYEIIATKNKLRGRGRAIALEFTSSPGKEMHLYGWSLNITVPT